MHELILLLYINDMHPTLQFPIGRKILYIEGKIIRNESLLGNVML